MTLDQLERLERTVMVMVVQALTDYREQAVTIFREESDQPQDIAEDVTREALEATSRKIRLSRVRNSSDSSRSGRPRPENASPWR